MNAINNAFSIILIVCCAVLIGSQLNWVIYLIKIKDRLGAFLNVLLIALLAFVLVNSSIGLFEKMVR